MAFSFVTKEGVSERGEIPKIEDKPVRAFARGATTGALGGYGDILSLIPGYPSGEQLPGQKAMADVESKASDLDLAALAGDLDPGLYYAPLPTSNQVSDLLTKAGIPKKEETPAEQGLGRFGKLFGQSVTIPGISPGGALSTSFTGAGLAELGKEMRAGPKTQAALEFVGMLRSLRLRAPTATGRIRQPRISQRNVRPAETGFISPDRLAQQLGRIEEEAAEIASTVGNSSPTFQRISQAIQSNHPIQERFNRIFNNLEATARNFNVPVNSQQLDTFLAREAQRYTRTGAPTNLSEFIMGEIQGWTQNGANNLYNMSRRFRLNNERVREIIDSVPRFERMSTSQRQQISFLTRMNESIANSFRDSFQSNLPNAQGQAGNNLSQWLNGFEESNRAYSNYLNTRVARNILDPILQRNITDRQITNFLANQRNWEDLNRFLGPQETGNLRQLLEDVQLARNSLQSMPRRDITNMALRHGIMTMIPGLGKLTNLLSIPHIWNWARGRYMSSPEFQHTFHEFAQALSERNVPAIIQAAHKLGEKEEKKEKKFTFVKSSTPSSSK